ncbi:glycosyltransferase family 4 protein [Paenibacillus sp. 598K]|uniref:glycosyltransferase family 4 protein n=1 Tax=Paenibacillus sp. 598K TaxID=1117987 RepID=UPI000FFE5EDA|nr:glycosyltransferase family 4 protein [Paenibacillus sp. 598K]
MRKKPVIVYVAHDVGGPGGMELHLEEVIQRLKNECELIVVSSSLKLKNAEGVRHIRIPVITRPVPVRLILFSIFASLRIVFLKRDILHTTGAIVFNRAEFSTVHFCHDGYLQAVGNTRSELNQSIWKKWNSRIAGGIARSMEKLVYRPERTKQLIAVSKRVKRELLAAFPYQEQEIAVIPNGVDLGRFKPCTQAEKIAFRSQYGLAESSTYLLFMGGDWSRKGLDLLVEAFVILADRYPDVGLLVVGKGDPQPYLQRLSESHRNRAVFVGKQPRPEEWMALSDIFVFPSSYETFSLVVHEAAAAGLTIFTTEVGGIEDLIRDGQDGIYIERDSRSLAEALAQVLEQPQAYRQLGTQARERVSPLTWEHTYREMMGQYQRMLTTTQNRGGRFEYVNRET